MCRDDSISSLRKENTQAMPFSLALNLPNFSLIYHVQIEIRDVTRLLRSRERRLQVEITPNEQVYQQEM